MPAPRIARLHLTDSCSFRCPTCSKWDASAWSAELSTDQWRGVLARLGRLPRVREAVLSGGEPFARRDLREIVEAGVRAGLRVSLVTNGWAVDAASLAWLREAGAAQLTVSLNSLDPAVHDASRGKPSSHARIMRLLDAWRAGRRQPRLCLAVVVMESNCRELADLARAASAWGVDGIVFQPVAPLEFHRAYAAGDAMPAPAPRWWASDPHWVRDAAIVGSQVAELLRLRRHGAPILNAAWHLRQLERYFRDPDRVPELDCLGTLDSIDVDPQGKLRLCGGLEPIGDALADDLAAAWRSPRADAVRRASRTCGHPCRLLNCNV